MSSGLREDMTMLVLRWMCGSLSTGPSEREWNSRVPQLPPRWVGEGGGASDRSGRRLAVEPLSELFLFWPATALVEGLVWSVLDPSRSREPIFARAAELRLRLLCTPECAAPPALPSAADTSALSTLLKSSRKMVSEAHLKTRPNWWNKVRQLSLLPEIVCPRS
jgi:hypothetical protein